MTEAPRNRPPSGYDEEFVSKVEDDFHCLICHLPLKEPVLTRCGHRFCKQCLEEHLRRRETDNQSYICPADREALDRDRDVFPDKATERKIFSFAIKCPSEGCKWTGELRNKEVHLETCPSKLVPCTNQNCRMTLKRKDLKQHVTNTCKWRIIECDHCREPHQECHMQEHIKHCNKFPVPCPNNCGDSIPREKILEHTTSDCPLSLIPCPYVQMGCSQKVMRKNKDSHLQSAMSRHLDLACEKLHNTQETTRKLEEKVEGLQRQLETKVSKEVVLMEKTADTTRLFIWKINEFSDVLRQALAGEKEKIASAPFYTDSYGYKLKVGINFHFSRMSRNARLSAVIFVMKGEYDALLPWPFNRNVKMTLIDQQEDSTVSRENISKHETVNLTRPKTEVSSGSIVTVYYEQLQTNFYLVDDTLFVQVEISPP